MHYPFLQHVSVNITDLIVVNLLYDTEACTFYVHFSAHHQQRLRSQPQIGLTNTPDCRIPRIYYHIIMTAHAFLISFLSSVTSDQDFEGDNNLNELLARCVAVCSNITALSIYAYSVQRTMDRRAERRRIHDSAYQNASSYDNIDDKALSGVICKTLMR